MGFFWGGGLAIGVENLQICWKYDQREVMSDFDSPVFDLKQSANTVKAYHTMDWPPQSPDFNIIEAVFDHLDGEPKKRALNALLLTL